MKYTFFTIILLSFLVILFSKCQSAVQKTKLTILADDDLKTTLDKIVINENIPGIVAAIADSTGIIMIEAAGARKFKSAEKVTPDDRLHLGSCTKAMTSAMLGSLVQDGQMEWDMTLAEVFPDLKDSLDQSYSNVTLHQLCTHRSGINANASDYFAYDSLDVTTARQKIMIDNLRNASKIETGQFEYSNLGYMIAGHMAEKITGKTWESLMQERLFDPLNMTSAGFGPPGVDKEINEPWGHRKLNETDWLPSQLDNAPALGPAGTVHSSMADWSTFLSSILLKKRNSILGRDQIDTLLDPVGDYACGWNVLDRPWGKGTVYNHSGSNTMWLSVVWAAPGINRAYLVVTNSLDDSSAKICDDIIGKLIAIDEQ